MSEILRCESINQYFNCCKFCNHDFEYGIDGAPPCVARSCDTRIAELEAKLTTAERERDAARAEQKKDMLEVGNLLAALFKAMGVESEPNVRRLIAALDRARTEGIAGT